MSESVDADQFRRVLGSFGTGVVVVAALDVTGRPGGLTVNSFASVSLRPPLVCFCPARTSTTWPRIRAAARLGISILADRQLPVCQRFAAPGAVDRFLDTDWHLSPGGAPYVGGALAWLECSLEDEYPGGDHRIALCRVHHLDRGGDVAPLLFHGGRYGTFVPATLRASS